MFSARYVEILADIMRGQLETMSIVADNSEEGLRAQFRMHVIDPVVGQFPSDGPLVISFLTSDVKGETGLGQNEYPTVTETTRYWNYSRLMEYNEIFRWTATGAAINLLIIRKRLAITLINREKLIRFLADNPSEANELYDLIITLDKKFVSKTMTDSTQRLKDKHYYFQGEEKDPNGPLLENQLDLQPRAEPVLSAESLALLPVPPEGHGRKAIYIAAAVLGGTLIMAGAVIIRSVWVVKKDVFTSSRTVRSG